MSLIVKLFLDHSAQCVTVRDPEQAKERHTGADVVRGISIFDAPWHLDIDPGQVQERDAAGGHRSRKFKWFSFQCNDPRCGAHGIVRLDSVSAAIQSALQVKL